VAGPRFVRPPPTFLVASTSDDVCPPELDTAPFVEAAERAGANVHYLLGDFGGHGFGLRRFWAEPCVAWMRSLGFGAAGAGERGVSELKEAEAVAVTAAAAACGG